MTSSFPARGTPKTRFPTRPIPVKLAVHPLPMLRKPSKSLLSVALLTAGTATAVPAAAETIELGYVVEIAGAQVMKAAYRTEIAGNQFESVLAGKTTGMSNMLSGYKMNLSAEGQFNGGEFLPGSFENNRKKKSKQNKTTGVIWSGAGNVRIEAAGGPIPVPAAVAEALTGMSSDPLTAVLRLANAQSQKPCSGRFRVFDGKDVYDLALSFKKTVTLASASESDPPGLECKLTSTPIAGNAVNDGETQTDSYGLTLAPVSLAQLGRTLYIPLRITGRSKGLSVVVTAGSVRIDGKVLAAGLGN